MSHVHTSCTCITAPKFANSRLRGCNARPSRLLKNKEVERKKEPCFLPKTKSLAVVALTWLLPLVIYGRYPQTCQATAASEAADATSANWGHHTSHLLRRRGQSGGRRGDLFENSAFETGGGGNVQRAQMVEELWSFYQPNSEKLMSIIASFDKVFKLLLSFSFIIARDDLIFFTMLWVVFLGHRHVT